ncbi:MAG: HAD family hydrolase [Oscillibacter sp.]|nr:HAD family hydrolase [Oscillibacter sp.]MBQ2995869.1 HAD family hydrolase [Oscillibacter sp.]
MFQTVIFDLDGTLLNTIGDLAAAGNYVCRQNGWPEHTVEAFTAMVGHGMANLVEQLTPPERRSAAVQETAMAQFSSYYGAHSCDLTTAYPDIPELLSKLKARGVQMAVYSNKPHAFTCALMEKFFPGMFALVWGKQDGVPVKPDPTGIRMILERLGAEKETTLFVGDSNVDVQTGHNARLRACGVTWGYRPAHTLREADYVADTVWQLQRVILEESV